MDSFDAFVSSTTQEFIVRDALDKLDKETLSAVMTFSAVYRMASYLEKNPAALKDNDFMIGAAALQTVLSLIPEDVAIRAAEFYQNIDKKLSD